MSRVPAITTILYCMGALVLATHGEEIRSETLLADHVSEWLNQHGSECPKEAIVTSDVQATIVGSNQKEVGNITIPTGTKVQVTQFAAEILNIKIGDLCMKVPTLNTDFAARVTTNYATSMRVGPPKEPGIKPHNPPEESVAPAGAITGWIGVYLGPVTQQYAERINLPNSPNAEYGARIMDVAVNSPAARHLLQPGDVITEYNRVLCS